jgi:hypothetical protein
MRLDVLEKTILLAIQKQIELTENLEEVLNNIRQAPVIQTKSAHLRQHLRLRKQELQKTEKLISGLYTDWKNGDLTGGQYRKLKEKFEQQEIQLREAIQHIQNEIGTMERSIPTEDPYLQTFLKHKNIRELTQGILLELVNTILIHENGGITIQFKLEDQYKRIIDSIENNKYTLTITENKVGSF